MVARIKKKERTTKSFIDAGLEFLRSETVGKVGSKRLEKNERFKKKILSLIDPKERNTLVKFQNDSIQAGRKNRCKTKSSWSGNVYVLWNDKRQFYIGSTNDVETRFQQHANAMKNGQQKADL